MKKVVKTKFRSEYPADFVFDYKDPVTLSRFLMEGGKIVPSRVSKLSSGQQRAVTRAIKRARTLGLLPNGTSAYDLFGRPEPVSAKPFSYK
jgi:small subunit ribosomal protein S18